MQSLGSTPVAPWSSRRPTGRHAGGVTVSYYEWVQDQQKLSWDGDEVRRRLSAQMRAALARVAEAAERLETDWRTASQVVAVERIAEASQLRSIYP